MSILSNHFPDVLTDLNAAESKPETTRQRKPRPKPARKIRLCLPPAPSGWGVVEITIGRKVDNYFLRRIGSDFGDGFRLEKFSGQGGESYDVHLSDQGHQCECLGFLRHGRCKHVAGLAKLRNLGKI